MEIYNVVLAVVLIYNNSLVLLGPTAWGTGVGPKRAFVMATLGQFLGAVSSNMPLLKIDLLEFLYITSIYTVLTYIKVSLPVAVVSYAVKEVRLDAVLFWLLTPLFALTSYVFCKTLRKGQFLPLVTLFLVMYMFGYNNVALFIRDPFIVVLTVLIGTYGGLYFSRWVLELAALRTRTVVSINLSVILSSLVATFFKIPISFTLVAYTSLFITSYTQRFRIIKAERFIKSYMGILIAVLAAAIFPALRSLLLQEA